MKKKCHIFLILLLILGLLIPVAAASPVDQPRIVDNAGLLSQAELQALENQAEQIRSTYASDAVIVTVDSLDGHTAQSYADSYYDTHGYGVGADASGVLLLIDMGSRQWYISTCGSAMSALSSREIQQLFDAMSDALSAGQYYNAFRNYLQALETKLGQETAFGSETTGQHTSYTAVRRIRITDLLIPLVVGVFAGGIGLLILRAGMHTKRRQSGAGDYLRQGSYHLLTHRDIYLYSRVHRVPIPKDNGGHSGGHRSGGHSHGGGGGKF